MADCIDEMEIGVATTATEAFRYVVVFDKRDLSREYFRGSLAGGRMHHVDRSALPGEVADRFADAMATEDDRG